MASYLRPETLEEALRLLWADAQNAPDLRLTILAGATDFYPVATTRQAWFQPHPDRILDISGIQTLGKMIDHDDHLRIGAMVTWSDVMGHTLPMAFDGLKAACRQVGGVQIQNRGTVVGNLCNASPAGDGIPPLLALDAKIEISRHGGCRCLPLADFVLGNRKTALLPGEMVSAILVPKPVSQERSCFLKLGARAYLVISIASVAANVLIDKRGLIEKVRIAVGACSAVGARLHGLEQRLIGQSLTSAGDSLHSEDFIVLSPIADIRASAEFRHAAAITLVRRALQQLSAKQEQNA